MVLFTWWVWIIILIIKYNFQAVSPVIITGRNRQYSFTKHCVILCKMFSKMLNEMGGWAGDNLVHWMSQVPTRKRYQSVNMLTGIAIPQPDSSPTAHQSMCWSCNVDKAPTPSRSCLGNKNIEKNGDGHMWKWCKIINVNNQFIK